jgi:hypothetical protein
VKGLVDPENISQNADYDQHLPSSASPPIPPSDNDIIDRKRPHIEHRNSLITDRFDEHESDSMHRDYDLANENDNRTELSPILNEHIRKRRKDSICDNPLPQKRLLLRTPESIVSVHLIYRSLLLACGMSLTISNLSSLSLSLSPQFGFLGILA